MRLISCLSLVLLAAAVFAPKSAVSATISGPSEIAASTSIGTCPVATCLGLGTDITQIVDGDTSDTNGFAGANGATGIITLDLLGHYDLTGFVLHNDVVVGAEGVGTFELRFLNAFDRLLQTSAVFTAPVGQVAGETYTFARTVYGVSKVEMNVLTVQNASRIEIREVAFLGSVIAPVPLPAGLPLLALGLCALGLSRRKA